MNKITTIASILVLGIVLFGCIGGGGQPQGGGNGAQQSVQPSIQQGGEVQATQGGGVEATQGGGFGTGICPDKLGHLETYLSEAGYDLSNAHPSSPGAGEPEDDGFQMCTEYFAISKDVNIDYSWFKNGNRAPRDNYCEQNIRTPGTAYPLDYSETLNFGDTSFVGYDKASEYSPDKLELFLFRGDQCYRVYITYVNARADVGKLKEVGQKLGKYLGW